MKYAGLAVKCAVAGSDDEVDRIRFYWADEICWEKQCQPAFVMWEGTYPEKENEILLSTRVLSELGIEQPTTGMEIPLIWSSLSADSDLNDCETVFHLTGWFEEYGSHNNGYVSKEFYEKTGVKQTDITNGVLYLSLENPLYSSAYIKKLGKQIGLAGNQVIYSDSLLLAKFVRLAAGILFLTVMTLISGALFVYNIFYISVAREIKYYGQYKTIGMTVNQMKKYLSWQIVWNVLLGIPAGLSLGCMVALRVVPHMLGALSAEGGTRQVVVFHPILLILAFVFTLLVVWIGCRQLLEKVARLTPIEAVRFNEAVGQRKKKRSAKEIGMFRMARWNIFRNRKRFLVSTASLCMVIIVFLVVSAILQQNSAKAILNKQYQYDARILNSKLRDDQEHAGITGELAEQISGMNGVKTVRKVYSQEVQYDYADTYKIMKDYMEAVYDLPLMSGSQLKENLEVWKNRSPGDETYQSIGMTRSQQKRMMAGEGFHYALIASGISLVAGLPLSYLISAAVNTYHTPYQPSILPNLLFFALLLDAGLSDGDGFKLCRELRDDALPVILLTARGMECDIVGGLDAGADDYIVKPVSLRVLTARIQALLRRTSNKENIYRMGSAIFLLPHIWNMRSRRTNFQFSVIFPRRR